MSSIFNVFKQKIFPSCLGVDIGTTAIKMVEVKQGEIIPQIVNYGILESHGHFQNANRVLQDSSLKMFDEDAAKLLRKLVETVKPKTRVAAASISSFSVFMTLITLPQMSAGDLERAMVFQAKQFVPLPISEVALDWAKVAEYEDEKGTKHQQILLSSVPREQIKKYKNIFSSAGLELKTLDIENFFMVRSLVGTDPTPTIILDIGGRSTNVSFVERGQLRYNAQSDFAGASLTQALSSSLSIGVARAEELKRERGIAATGPNMELSTIMIPFLDVILNEVKKAQYNYAAQFPGAAKPERVILSGGGANLRGIEKYAALQLGIPVLRAKPFLNFTYPDAIQPFIEELNPVFSVALGAALREIT